ncbi:hypothetical protein PCYB_004910, partial [Plasmodium cynomolgi strain B]
VQKFSIDELLHTGKFYKNLETLSTSADYHKLCGSRDEPVFESMHFKKICVAILNYLKNNYSASNHTSNGYDDCKLLSYGAYSRIFDILREKRYTIIPYAQLQRIWNGFIERLPENQRCKPIHEMLSYTDWRERKELYEYYVNYSLIVDLANSYNERCNEFYEYVKKKAHLYEYFEEKCRYKSTIICPEFCEDSKKYNPKNVLSNFSCHHEKIDEIHADVPSALKKKIHF